MAISICIIDDEQDAQNVLLKLTEYSSTDFNILGVANSYESAIVLLQNHTPNILFLDINLGGKSGLELATMVDVKQTSIVFVTAYDNHVLEALRLKAFDYLFKPVFLTDFEEVIERYISNQQVLKEESLITLVNNDGQHLIKINDVDFIEAAGAYCVFNLNTLEKIMVSKPLKSFTNSFNEINGFLRTHKSYLVNKYAIAKVIYGENQILLKSDKVIPISRNQKSNLKKMLE